MVYELEVFENSSGDVAGPLILMLAGFHRGEIARVLRVNNLP